ncbi:MAG: YlxR family protein [Deltaproteobacteria bacterium]|nr:YlxR family protein [Deltaproteobacteria bacterium]
MPTQAQAHERTTPSGRRAPRSGRLAALHGCVRSCAACRARAPRDALLRFALVDGRVAFDIDKRLSGRGLSLGPSPHCLAQAHKRGVFHRQWKVALSAEDLAVLVAGVRLTLEDKLAHWLADAHRRGALAPTPLEALVPPTRALWSEGALAHLVGAVPPGVATTPRAARKLAALAHAVSQFTFQGAGDKKRRPEAADICSALAPDLGPPEAPGRVQSARAYGRESRAAQDASVVSPVPVSSAGEGLVPLAGHPSGGSE